MRQQDDLKRTLLLATTLVALWSGSSHAADGLSIVNAGNAAGAPACASCHGVHGEGNADSEFPRLAGMNASYLVHQLNSLADGTRTSDVMSSVAKSLSSEERQAVADYYASQQTPQGAADGVVPPDVVARGRNIAKLGLWEKGIPGCATCHGAQGRGVGESFPPLSGQSAKYIEDQLAAFADGHRKNDPMHLMRGIAQKLSKDDVSAVAAYYANPSDIAGKRETK